MPEVLTTNAIIACPHGGLGTSTPSERIWTVNGGIVLVESDTGDLINCTSNLNCKSYVLKSMGLNATRIRGKRVILVTDFNQTLTGLPLTITEIHEVLDKSVPTPLVDGQPPPPLSAAMDDKIKPQVTSSFPELLFSKSGPVSLTVTFKLTSAHPLRKALILVNEPEGTKVDLTSTTPPGVTIDELGGNWDVSSLSVIVALDVPFLQALLVGEHLFYMTGINQRGLSETFVLPLKVTA